MSFHNRNQKWPFRWTGRSRGLDLPLDLPIWAFRIAIKMIVFPLISLETPYRCIETLGRGLYVLRWSIWGVTCLGLLSKWMFSHLSPWKPNKCVLRPLEQGSFFPRQSIWGVTCLGLLSTWTFPIYLLGNCINGCWNPQNRACFSKMINLRGHMPRFTLKMNVFPSNLLETLKMCVETLRTGLIFPRQSIWGVTCLGLL